MLCGILQRAANDRLGHQSVPHYCIATAAYHRLSPDPVLWSTLRRLASICLGQVMPLARNQLPPPQGRGSSRLIVHQPRSSPVP